MTVATKTPTDKTYLTYEDYMAEPEIMARYDILDGDRIFMTQPSDQHQDIVLSIGELLRGYQRRTKSSRVKIAPCDVLITRVPLRTRQPDVLLISQERYAGRTPKDASPFDPAPELVVEVVSPSETLGIRAGKIRDYCSVDVRECWLVRPEAETVEVLRLTPAGPARAALYGPGQTLQSLAFRALRSQWMTYFRSRDETVVVMEAVVPTEVEKSKALIGSLGDPLTIGGKTFRSRLFLGTGKYRNAEEMNAALEASGCEIVTVALRRIDLDAPKRSILDEIDWTKYHILPNTAGARTADEAIRIARLARAMGLSDWIKVEVIPDPKYLLPDPIGTFEACKVLVAEGFIVLPYINADPALALRLQEIGTHTVMPLASPIGSGQGMRTREQVRIIIEQATVPVVVDAGIGVPSEASEAMELGASACLVNTAIARAADPALMADAMRMGVEAGRKAYLAGRMPVLPYASASSPLEGVVR